MNPMSGEGDFNEPILRPREIGSRRLGDRG